MEMENSIKLSELLILLVIFWSPIFLISGYIQFKILQNTKFKMRKLLILLSAQVILAFIILFSPLYKVFLHFDFIGSLPLQSAVISSIIMTTLLWIIISSKIK